MCFASGSNQTIAEKSKDIQSKILNIYEMQNGKKFAKPKLLLFGGPTNGSVNDKSLEEQNSGLSIEDPERHSQLVAVKSDPLFAVFAWYRYYILQDKYKSVVKFNFEHPAIHAKRDQIMEEVNKEELSEYWKATILSFVCV